MIKKNMAQSKRLHVTYLDWQRALVFFIPALLLIILVVALDLPQPFAIAALLAVLLMSLAGNGVSKLQQCFCFFLTSLFFFLSIVMAHVANYLDVMAPAVVYYAYIALCVFFWSMLPWFNTRFANASLCAAILFLFAPALLRSATSYATSDWQVACMYMAGIALAGAVIVAVNSLLPQVSLATPKRACFRFFIIRALRVSLAVIICYMICRVFSIRHEEWAALAVLVVSQANLGATVKRSMDRLLGTFAGVLGALPLMYFLFLPYPWSRLIALPMLGMAWLWFRASYVLAIFFLTLSLGALYFMLYPPHPSAAVAYVVIRLAETSLGVAVMLSLEFVFFPRRIVAEMRHDARFFWWQIEQAVDAFSDSKLAPAEKVDLVSGMQEESNVVVASRLDLAKIHLKSLSEKLADYHYEPLAMLTTRYHAASVLLNHLYHFYYYIVSCHTKGKIVASDYALLLRFVSAMQHQYDARNFSLRYLQLLRLYKELSGGDLVELRGKISKAIGAPKLHDSSTKNNHPFGPAYPQLEQVLLRIIEVYLVLIKSQRFSLKW